MLECPYFYYGIGQMRLSFRSMNSESKYKALNSFQKIGCGFFGLRYVTKRIDCYEIESLKNGENRYCSPEFDML